ncbi:J domain-containing protein [Cyanobium sp. FGCU-6]|jgi:curved DNA-binding protein CbpA|nr:J domain-containing protein [Cyanobium sp. FGCU6]
MSSPPASGHDAFADGAGSDPYLVLQLPATASTDDLRTAFRRLSKEVHPDTTTLPAAEAQEAFRQLRQAYALLSDPERRRAFDAHRRAVAASPWVGGGRPVSGRPVTLVSSRPEPVRRALSGGEWFALVLLAVALVLSLVLGLGVAWARGAELVRQPSWWGELRQEFQAPEAESLEPASPATARATGPIPSSLPSSVPQP